MARSKLNLILFAFLACLWSGSFIGIKAVVNVWPPIFGGMIRIAIAVLCLTIIIFSSRKSIAIANTVRWKIWIIGIFSQGIPFTLLFWGEHLISPGLAGILNGTVAIWTYILSLIFLPQFTTFSMTKSAGLAMGLLGVIIIFWPIIAADHRHCSLLGAGAVLIMAISYAIGALLNQRLLAGKVRVEFFANLFHQQYASLIFLLLASLIFEKWPSVALITSSHIPWFASIYLGFFSTAIAWIIYYHLIREWDAVCASAVMYVVPVLTLIWDYLFFATKPHLSEIGGVVTILCGVVLIQFSNFRKKCHI